MVGSYHGGDYYDVLASVCVFLAQASDMQPFSEAGMSRALVRAGSEKPVSVYD
jgi:hypothetical protein